MTHRSAICFSCQGSSGVSGTDLPLTQIDSITFEYRLQEILGDIPVDTDVTIKVRDEPVDALNDVARDIYVNGVKVSVTQSGQSEYGHFRVRIDGTVY